MKPASLRLIILLNAWYTARDFCAPNWRRAMCHLLGSIPAEVSDNLMRR